MKRKQKRIFLLCVGLYLLAMCCATAASVVSIYRSNRNLVQIAAEDLRYYLKENAISPSAAEFNANNVVYTPDWRRAASHFSYGSSDSFDFDALARRLAPSAKERGEVFRLLFTGRLEHHIAVAVVLPMPDGGVFVFLREITDAYRPLLTLYLGITLLAAVVIVYQFLLLRNSAALEREQREYIDNINHELKSPVAAVKALAEPLHDGLVSDPETLRRYSALMLREMSGLERTISDMLELSRLQSKRTDATREAITAQAAFGDVVEKYTTLCDEFGLRFTVEPPLCDCPELHTNGPLAARMLEILLNNAFKFTEASGSIYIHIRPRLRSVRIAVGNDGPEIPTEDRKHIFERYYQGGKSHANAGSGLGLAIAQEIADCLNEELRLAHSVPGDTVFTFTLKRQQGGR